MKTAYLFLYTPETGDSYFDIYSTPNPKFPAGGRFMSPLRCCRTANTYKEAKDELLEYCRAYSEDEEHSYAIQRLGISGQRQYFAPHWPVMTSDQFDQIFRVLQKELEVSDGFKDSLWARICWDMVEKRFLGPFSEFEFRIDGLLGASGTFRFTHHQGYYVECLLRNKTLDRAVRIAAVNKAIVEMGWAE